MKISESTITDLKVITPDIFGDFRGEYVETWNATQWDLRTPRYDGGILGHVPIKFVQDDISVSSQNVLRGLHGDRYTWKLVQCMYGSLLLAVVDCRKSSPTYGLSETFTLNDKTRKQVLVPPGCANGHLCLSSQCIFHYKQSTYYNEHPQFTLGWDKSNIFWPVKNPILSERDTKGLSLTQIAVE